MAEVKLNGASLTSPTIADLPQRNSIVHRRKHLNWYSSNTYATLSIPFPLLPTPMHAHRHQISRPESGGNYQLSSFHFGEPGRGKKVYIQAALHADEIPGMLVSQFLRKALLAAEADGSLVGEVILVPAANPLGLAQAIHGAPFGRFDLSTGTNFNRAYKHVAEELKLSLAGKLGADAAANVSLIREHALCCRLATIDRRRGAEENPAGLGHRC
jgi:hypothetical protein